MAKSQEVIAQIVYYRMVEQWPVGTVARHLNVHEDTVNRYTQAYLFESEQVTMDNQSGRRKRASLINKFIPFIEETYKHTVNTRRTHID